MPPDRQPNNEYFYCLQCSCSKVMFSQASVILFTGGVSQIPHSTDTPLGRHLPPGRHPLPPEMATAADGTHPAGMHSSYFLKLLTGVGTHFYEKSWIRHCNDL